MNLFYKQDKDGTNLINMLNSLSDKKLIQASNTLKNSLVQLLSLKYWLMSLKKAMNEKVSVIMSVYNAEQTLVNSIESIINQTYKNLEILICDDFSTDDSLKILETYKSQDKRIQIIKNNENIGLTKSLNKLIKKATGKYIARHDADDISMLYRIEKQLSALKNPKKELLLAGH